MVDLMNGLPNLSTGKEYPELLLTMITVKAEVPAGPQGWSSSIRPTATFLVDPKTWTATGHFEAPIPIITDRDWWAEQCQKVANRVRASVSITTPI